MRKAISKRLSASRKARPRVGSTAGVSTILTGSTPKCRRVGGPGTKLGRKVQGRGCQGLRYRQIRAEHRKMDVDARSPGAPRGLSQFGNFRDFRRSICTGSQKLVNSPRVQRCLDKAAYCREMAAVATDCTAKAAFEDAACCWRELATLLEWLDQG